MGIPTGCAVNAGKPSPSGINGFGQAFIGDVVVLRPQLYRRALGMTANRHDAEDLVQDTLFRACIGFGSFEPGTNLAAWLHRIMTNSYINGYRKLQRQPPTCSIDLLGDHRMAAVTRDRSRSAEEQAIDNLTDARIVATMRRLPAQMAEAVFYADVAGLRRRHIAQITGAPPGTVMTRLHRGRHQLRVLLADVGDERGWRARNPSTAARPRTATSANICRGKAKGLVGQEKGIRKDAR
ncbi:RNA polymerase sigma-70 factor (ECF subfamily) [Mycobacterium sp. OAS707]|uniref:sigma-70 family RNA polymerase sigma factor n=1 Tax=Mycobacterium sp. OAS707 TaxID=2663822 RepID=UPI0017890131|nr:sigma-70 family RNA polymerase sigma factor [Mycobacterium sp. OAS707]MBE1552158.1 RNA polymerase sigma-70 factor (ECF subfamily) [Mycobacterium sp. OAS707]